MRLTNDESMNLVRSYTEHLRQLGKYMSAYESHDGTIKLVQHKTNTVLMWTPTWECMAYYLAGLLRDRESL